MTKRILALLCILALTMVMLCVPVFADHEGTYIRDCLEFFSEEELETLNDYAAKLHDTYGFDAYFEIYDAQYAEDSSGDPEEMFCRLSGEDADGVYLVADYGDYKWRIYRSGSASTLFDGADEMLFEAYNGDDTYYGGVKAYLDMIAAVLETGDVGAVTAPQSEETAEKTDLRLGRLTDQAILLSSAEFDALAKKLDEISNRRNFDVTVVTMESIGQETPRDFAAFVYDNAGFRPDGIILLINMEGRDVYLLASDGYGSEVFAPETLDYIRESITPKLSKGDYYGAFSDYAGYCDEMIGLAESGTPYEVKQKPLGALWVLISGAVGAMTAGIRTGVMRSELKSVHSRAEASEYIAEGSMELTRSNEVFLYRQVSRTRRANSDSSRSGSSGRSGSGGKF